MSSKQERHQVVVDLVQRQRIRSQDALRAALCAAGAEVTQSTLSRDLVELGVSKRDGRYVLPSDSGQIPPRLDLSPVVHGWVGCGPHMIVVRTAAGQAQSVAVEIDRHAERSIAGTIAGDDTIFLATHNSKQQAVAVRRLSTWFGAHS